MSEEELVEAVARAMAEYDYGDGNDEPWEPFAGLARAIIPIVKEADARIAEQSIVDHEVIERAARDGDELTRRVYTEENHLLRVIAAAIRGEA